MDVEKNRSFSHCSFSTLKCVVRVRIIAKGNTCWLYYQ